MPSQVVGLENLPNVYIKQIQINENTEQFYRVIVTLEMFDKIEGDREIWSNHDNFSPFIKVCLLHTMQPLVADSITNGTLSPLPTKVVHLENYDPERTSAAVMGIREFSAVEHEGMHTFTKYIEFDLGKTVQDSVLFVYSYVDTAAVADHYQIDMSGDLEQYYGAVASDFILQNGQVPTMTNIFISPDNTMWSGPVHFHPTRGYMQGSFHTQFYHAILTHKRVQNAKVIDNRTPEILPGDVNVSMTEANPIIGESSYTVDTHSNLTGFVPINIEQLVLSKTYLGDKIRNLSYDLFSSFMSTLKFNSITITRQNVRTRRVANSLGTPMIGVDSVSESQIIATAIYSPDQELQSENIEEIGIGADYNLRYYTFLDETQTSLDEGEYRYQMSLSIIDKSQEFINDEISSLNSSYNGLVEIVDFLNNPNRYDYSLKSLKQGVVMPASIIGIVERYYRAYSYFNKITKQQRETLIQNRVNSLAAGNYSTQAAETFLQEYRQLITVFESEFKINEEQGTTTSAKNIKKSVMPNLITIDKTFDEIIKFSEYRRSYDYLGSKTKGLTVMSKKEYKKRAETEVSRFFDTSKSLLDPMEDTDMNGLLDPMEDTDMNGVLGTNVASAIVNFSKSKYMFFSPLNFKFDKEHLDLTSLGSVDNDKLTAVFLKSTEVANSHHKHYRQSFGKSAHRGASKTRERTSQFQFNSGKKQNRFSFTPAPPVVKTSDLIEERHIDASNYLGPDSQFNNILDNLTVEQVPSTSAEIETALEMTSITTTTRNRNKYNVSKKNNVIDIFKNSSKFSISTLRNAPIAFKALIASRTPAARNNIISSTVDILKDPSMKVATEMMFQSIQKIEMFAGFQMNKQGVKMVSKPIWVDMDPDLIGNSPILCRMRYAEIPDLDIKPDPQYKIPPRDALFVISDSDPAQNINRVPMSNPNANNNIQLTNAIAVKIKYASSNIITQNVEGSIFESETSTPSTEGTTNTAPVPSESSDAPIVETLPKDTNVGGY